MEKPFPRKRAALLVILAMAVAPFFIALSDSTLWDSNEAFYAETPREMIESGNYINPSFNYQPRFNKPPLSYWVVALFYKIFGVSEQAERLAIAFAAVVIIGAAFALARSGFGFDAGLFAAIALAATPRFLMFSRRIMIDVYVAMFMALALALFVLAEKDQSRRRLYLALMYAAVGLGILTKGPVAALLPGIIFFVYLALAGRLSRLKEMMIPAGAVIIAAIVLPWYAMIYHEHGWPYIKTFILEDNLSRYTNPVWGPRRGAFFYAPVLIGDLLPWSVFLLPALWLAVRERMNLKKIASEPASQALTRGARPALLLAVWIVVIVVFFSLSQNKEDLYILPIYPAAAALVGGFVCRFLPKEKTYSLLRWLIVVAGLLIAIIGAGLLFIFYSAAQSYKIAGVDLIGYIWLAGGITAAALSKKEFKAAAAIAIAVIASHWTLVLRTLPDFERYKPVRPLCEIIQARAGDAALVGYYRFASPSMVFYLRRQIFEYYQPEQLQSAFSSGRDVYCLMTAQDYEALKQTLPAPIYVLASRPVFQVKLKVIFDKGEPPEVILISNRSETGSS